MLSLTLWPPSNHGPENTCPLGVSVPTPPTPKLYGEPKQPKVTATNHFRSNPFEHYILCTHLFFLNANVRCFIHIYIYIYIIIKFVLFILK